MMSIFCASGRKARIAKSSPTRWGPRIRNGSECVPERKLFNSSGGNPVISKGRMGKLQPRSCHALFNCTLLRQRNDRGSGDRQIQIGIICRASVSDAKSKNIALWRFTETPCKIRQNCYFFGRSSGNRITSRIDSAPVSNMVSRSIPRPKPPAGGMPCSSATRNSSSTFCVSSPACSSKR